MSNIMSRLQLSDLPPELRIPMFDHLIALQRAIPITTKSDYESATDVILSLRSISTLFRDSIADWLRSRPQLISSGFRGIGIYDPACTRFVLDLSKEGGVTDKIYMDQGYVPQYQKIWNAEDGSFIRNAQHIEIDARWGCCDEQDECHGDNVLMKPFLRLKKLQALKRVDIIIGEKRWDLLIRGGEVGDREWIHIWGHIFLWFKRCPLTKECSCCGPLPKVMVGNGKKGLEEAWVSLRWNPTGLQSGASKVREFQHSMNFKVQTRQIYELNDLKQQGLRVAGERAAMLKYTSLSKLPAWDYQMLESGILSLTPLQLTQLMANEFRMGETTVNESKNEGIEEKIVEERMYLEDQRRRLEVDKPNPKALLAEIKRYAS